MMCVRSIQTPHVGSRGFNVPDMPPTSRLLVNIRIFIHDLSKGKWAAYAPMMSSGASW